MDRFYFESNVTTGFVINHASIAVASFSIVRAIIKGFDRSVLYTALFERINFPHASRTLIRKRDPREREYSRDILCKI